MITSTLYVSRVDYAKPPATARVRGWHPDTGAPIDIVCPVVATLAVRRGKMHVTLDGRMCHFDIPKPEVK